MLMKEQPPDVLMSSESAFCGFCGQPIPISESMQVWTEDGRVHGIVLLVRGAEIRHVCGR